MAFSEVVLSTAASLLHVQARLLSLAVACADSPQYPHLTLHIVGVLYSRVIFVPRVPGACGYLKGVSPSGSRVTGGCEQSGC